ncbi:MAG: DUF262 domain-containing protein [Bacteroidales bacterium]|nr:DUF262 domain-containing protein [Bacteroidales bacterium]
MLLNDIINAEVADRGTHFIGSIVYVYEGHFIQREVNELVVIHGQQRLTTISLLIAALNAFAKYNKLPNEADMFYNIYLTYQYFVLSCYY